MEGGAVPGKWSRKSWGGILGAETDGELELGTASREEGFSSVLGVRRARDVSPNLADLFPH